MKQLDLISEARKYCDDHKLSTHFEHGGKVIYPKDVIDAYVAARTVSLKRIKELEKLISDTYDAQNG